MASTVLVMSAGSALAQNPAKVESFRQQLHADLPSLYAMDRAGRHAYLRNSTAKLSREDRRSFKAALEQFRLESGIDKTIDEGPKKALPEPKSEAEKVALAAGTRMKMLAGNITYDTGVVTGTGGVASQMLGNRFNSALNPAGTACCFPVATSGTITMVTFEMVNTFFSSAVFSIYSNVMGTTANQVTSMAIPGIMTGLNTLTVGGGGTMNSYANGSYLAGIWQFDVTMTALAVDSNSNAGQGFHAISLNDGAMGSMLTDIPSRNAIFRVTTPNGLTPVELLEFKIEE